MRLFVKDCKKDFDYTWEHKKAILRIEKELLGYNTLDGYLHDTDKLFLYLLFTKKETSVIHRSYSRHHTGNHKSHNDIINALIDWESARMTKPDKQETAREYLYKCIPEWGNYYEPYLKKLGL